MNTPPLTPETARALHGSVVLLQRGTALNLRAFLVVDIGDEWPLLWTVNDVRLARRTHAGMTSGHLSHRDGGMLVSVPFDEDSVLARAEQHTGFSEVPNLFGVARFATRKHALAACEMCGWQESTVAERDGAWYVWPDSPRNWDEFSALYAAIMLDSRLHYIDPR